MRSSVALSASLIAALCFSAPVAAADTAAQAGMELFQQFNVYTLGDLNSTSHVQGKVWVGGNLTGNLIAAQGGGSALASDYAELTVKGASSANIKIEGSQTAGRSSLVQIGGNSTGEVGLNGSGGHVDAGGTFNTQNFNPNATKTYSANVPGLASQISLNTADFSNNLQALSTALSALPATAITNMNQALTVSGDYTIFSMTKSQFQTQNYSFDTLFNNIGSDKTIVINVLGGGSINEDNGANNNALSLSSNIIWNFGDATSVSVKNWAGSILATNATVTNSSTITGSVVAKIFNQNGEVHLGTFDGSSRFLVTSGGGSPVGGVPEPASWMTMLLGFGVTGSLIRRARRRHAALAA